ncbi:MAG: D-arabinose 5-phosphate isomerase [Gammaproteobacteria bacterium]|nr:D-arabinose 5-phosphate isomerase [Gammaproteobacteria bacterium]
MKDLDIKSIAKEAIQIEAEAVLELKNRVGDVFEDAVKSILKCSGRLIVTGIGKSGHICQKIASTMASTGTPSHFVHPSEAIHGDLGMITKHDILLIVSNSGETSELVSILPALKEKKIKIIGLIGVKNSTLALQSDFYLDTSVSKEACTLDLAPTASTTATIAMGDAIAISTLELRGFNEGDFAKLHPGGSLGKRLLLKVDQIMHSDDRIPLISVTTKVKDALLYISEKGFGMTGVLNNLDTMVGIITDGDVRRALEKEGNNIFDQTAESLMSKNPKWISASTLAISALKLMEKYSITSLFVYSDKELKKPNGVIHIHDLLKIGL